MLNSPKKRQAEALKRAVMSKEVELSALKEKLMQVESSVMEELNTPPTPSGWLQKLRKGKLKAAQLSERVWLGLKEWSKEWYSSLKRDLQAFQRHFKGGFRVDRAVNQRSDNNLSLNDTFGTAPMKSEWLEDPWFVFRNKVAIVSLNGFALLTLMVSMLGLVSILMVDPGELWDNASVLLSFLFASCFLRSQALGMGENVQKVQHAHRIRDMGQNIKESLSLHRWRGLGKRKDEVIDLNSVKTKDQ